MTEFRTDTGPEWPERLTRFNAFEWSAEEIERAAAEYAEVRRQAGGMDEPPPPSPLHLTASFAWSWFRRKWAKEHAREQDLVDQMIRNRLARQHLYIDDTEADA